MQLPYTCRKATGFSRDFQKLSAREAEVIRLAASGYVDKQIGAELGMSVNTVRTYWTRIRRKLGDVPRTGLIAAFVEHSLVGLIPAQSSHIQWDWEIALVQCIFRRISQKPLPVDVAPSEEIPLESFWAAIHPDDSQRVLTHLEDLWQSDVDSYLSVFRMITKDGVFAMSSAVVVVRNEASEPVTLLGIRLPIFDLRARQVSSVTMGIWRLNLRTGEFWANSSYREIYRLPLDEPLTFEDVLREIHPDHVGELQERLESIRAGKVPEQRIRYKIRYPDGVTRWANCEFKLELDPSGDERVVGTVTVFD